MTTINLATSDQLLMIGTQPTISSGNRNSMLLKVEFDKTWDGYATSAVFFTDKRKNEIYEIILNNGSCTIPHEVLAEATFLFIGVRGVISDDKKVKTSSLVRYKITEGAPEGTETTSLPTASVYHQLLTSSNMMQARLNNLIEGTTEDSELELMDIRVGHDGTIYESAGEAVRSQISDVLEVIDNSTPEDMYYWKTVNFSGENRTFTVGEDFKLWDEFTFKFLATNKDLVEIVYITPTGLELVPNWVSSGNEYEEIFLIADGDYESIRVNSYVDVELFTRIGTVQDLKNELDFEKSRIDTLVVLEEETNNKISSLFGSERSVNPVWESGSFNASETYPPSIVNNANRLHTPESDPIPLKIGDKFELPYTQGVVDYQYSLYWFSADGTYNYVPQKAYTAPYEVTEDGDYFISLRRNDSSLVASADDITFILVQGESIIDEVRNEIDELEVKIDANVKALNARIDALGTNSGGNNSGTGGGNTTEPTGIVWSYGQWYYLQDNEIKGPLSNGTHACTSLVLGAGDEIKNKDTGTYEIRIFYYNNGVATQIVLNPATLKFTANIETEYRIRLKRLDNTLPTDADIEACFELTKASGSGTGSDNNSGTNSDTGTGTGGNNSTDNSGEGDSSNNISNQEFEQLSIEVDELKERMTAIDGKGTETSIEWTLGKQYILSNGELITSNQSSTGIAELVLCVGDSIANTDTSKGEIIVFYDLDGVIQQVVLNAVLTRFYADADRTYYVRAKQLSGNPASVEEIGTFFELTRIGSGSGILGNLEENYETYQVPEYVKGILNAKCKDFDENSSTRLQDLYDWYDELSIAFSSSMTKTQYGTTQTPEGVCAEADSNTYPMCAYTIAPLKYAKHKIILAYGIHGNGNGGDAIEGVIGLAYFVKDLLNNYLKHPTMKYIREYCTVVVMPVLNPWGYQNNSRGNGRNIDLNRNFSVGFVANQTSPSEANQATFNGDTIKSGASAFCEQESQNIRDYIRDNHSDAVFMLEGHSRGKTDRLLNRFQTYVADVDMSTEQANAINKSSKRLVEKYGGNYVGTTSSTVNGQCFRYFRDTFNFFAYENEAFGRYVLPTDSTTEQKDATMSKTDGTDLTQIQATDFVASTILAVAESFWLASND